MAVLEWEQKPVNTTSKVPVITNWTPLIGYMLERTTSIASLFYYKLVLEVYTGHAVSATYLIAKLKQRRNGYSVDVTNNLARAFFDLRDVANSILVDTVFDQNQTGIPFEPIHNLGANTGVTAKIFSLNGDRNTGETQIVALTVRGLENYSSAADTSPADVTTHAITDTLYYMQASLPLFTPRSGSGYVQSDAFANFNASDSNDQFLSDLAADTAFYGSNQQSVLSDVYFNYVLSNDRHTVAFLNDNDEFNSGIQNIQIQYYDSDGAAIGITREILNSSANGGWKADNSEAGTPSDPMKSDAQLLYFGCGPHNLQTQTIDANARPSAHSGWAYYTIRGIKTKASPDPQTSLYYFVNQDASCKGFKVRRLAWRNSVGGYDYFNFKMKSTQTVDVERNTYSSMIGTFNKTQWRYNDTQRGKATRQVVATLKETLNTDWLTEPQANLMEKLIMSRDVYIVTNADTEYTQAVMVTDSSHIRKTVANDGIRIQYSIKIEYANPLNTNS